MARLQILELPTVYREDGPDETPFVLVVDQCVPQRIVLGAEAPYRDSWQNLAQQIGACGVIVTPETVTIPVNETLPLPLLPAETDARERAGTTQIVYAHERTRLDLCSALLLGSGTTWRKVIEQASERQRELADLHRSHDAHKADILDALGMECTRDWDDIRNAAAGIRKQRDAQNEAIERVRRESTDPEVMDAEQEHPSVWQHGYRCGVLAAKSALRPRDEKASR